MLLCALILLLLLMGYHLILLLTFLDDCRIWIIISKHWTWIDPKHHARLNLNGCWIGWSRCLMNLYRRPNPLILLLNYRIRIGGLWILHICYIMAHRLLLNGCLKIMKNVVAAYWPITTLTIITRASLLFDVAINFARNFIPFRFELSRRLSTTCQILMQIAISALISICTLNSIGSMRRYITKAHRISQVTCLITSPRLVFKAILKFVWKLRWYRSLLEI